MTTVEELSDEELSAWFDRVMADAAERYPGEPTTIAYGRHVQQVIDLWGDMRAPLVVVSVHGGEQ